MRWVAEADRLPRLRLMAERLATSAVRPFREIPSRAHFRLPPAEPGGAGTFVKQYRLLGWPRRLRHLVRPLPAAVEWSVARALAPHGLAAVTPWAWGVRRQHGVPIECYLVADDLGELVTLEEWIPRHRHLPSAAFRGALADLSRTLRRLHGLHYFHGDPHQRNIIPIEGPQGLRWAFLDFQQARRARLTAPYRRVRDLGRVFHGVRLDLGRFQRAHLLRAYLGAGTRLPRRLFRLLEAITLYYEFRLLRRRARRCLTITDHFRRTALGPLDVWHTADVDVARIAACLHNRKGPEDLAFVVTPLAGRGRRVWLRAHALVARGLPTPRPLAWARDAERDLEYLVTDRPKGAVPLEAALEAARDTADLAALMQATGGALRRLHDLGAWRVAAAHGILAVRGSSGGAASFEVFWARPEAIRFRPCVGRSHRRRDVARLAAAVGSAGHGIPAGAWDAFLRGYLPPGAAAARVEELRRLIRPRAGIS